MDIVGCGGIHCGQDVWEYILAGSTAVQIGTTLMKEGPNCFNRITQELHQWFNSSTFKNWQDAKGKVTPCSLEELETKENTNLIESH